MIHQRFSGILIGATLVLAQPVGAAPTEATAVRLNPTANGVEVIFDTQGNRRTQVFTVNRGNSSVADITNTQLRLPGGKPLRQDNPAPGITSVVVSQLDANTIRVVVSGATKAPTGQVIRRDNPAGLVLSFSRVPGETPQATPPTTPTPAQQPPSTGQRPNSVPANLPRAVAPPVGDIAVAPIDITPETIDLGTSERVTKLLLREAPVQEALTLLARAAGLNLIYTPPEAKPAKTTRETTRTSNGGATSSGGTTSGRGTTESAESTETTTTVEEARPGAENGQIKVSLDIENEPVQDAFNQILRLSGLQANRVGQTIFVGGSDSRNRIVRTYRLNQIKATASGTVTQTFSATAQTGGSVSGSSSSIGGGSSSISGSSPSLATSSINRTTDNEEKITNQGAKEILTSYGANGGETSGTSSGSTDSGTSSTGGPSSTLLKGLEVVADARANSVTLIGSPYVVEIATSLLKQIDLRRRQVAVSVKIVDVDLTKGRNANADLQFNSAGIPGIEGNSVTASFTDGIFQVGAFGTNFLLNLLNSIQDDNAKILTSPTLMVQEGSSAQVNLTQEIFSGIVRTSSAVGTAGSLPVITEEPIIRPAGVILNMTVDRIDDNGFITLNLSPEVSAPSGTFVLAGGTTGTLLRQRRLETGQMRLRDGQTFILTGIIQDEDRASVTKVPILGDIPLLGRLFRREINSRTRRELVVVVTPRILDDSDQSSFGYEYNPSPEAQKLLKKGR